MQDDRNGHTPDPQADTSAETETAYTPSDESYDSYEPYGDPYAGDVPAAEVKTAAPAVTAAEPPSTAPPATGSNGGGSQTPPPPPDDDEGDADEEGMVRMSFMEHLEELRHRLMRCLIGIGVAFVISLVFANQLWVVVSAPAMDALRTLGFQEHLAQIKPMETFTTVWVKLPILTAIFLASPWILYQVWAFIAPGLYRRERRWAAPFIIFSAGLFIAGGLFAYFVAFRFGLTFLLGIGRDINIMPMVSVTEYFNLFVNITLGIALVFELPVLIFFLTLLRVISPSFLLRNSRYAILIIVILAAFITPTPDVVNLMLFVVPMVLLFYIGIFASYLLVLHREQRGFPWRAVLYTLGVLALAISGVVYFAVTKYGYELVPYWPFLTR